MKADFFSREIHHKEHAMAVYKELPKEYQGVFTDNIDKVKSDIVVTFSYGDLKQMDLMGKKTIYSDHGVGFYFNNIHPSYAGSVQHRENLILRLSPNERHAKREREILKCPVVVVGMPKIDKYADKKFRVKTFQPTVAIGFHWDCHANPETRSAYAFYRNYFKSWKASGMKIIGHGHPRIFKKLVPIYESCGIRPVEDFNEVIKKADVYASDSGSSVFEFAFTKKPVVLLNCPFFRKNVTHEGCPRFWKYADIGPQVDNPKDFPAMVKYALKNREEFLPRIETMRKDIFAFTDGKCSERAAEAIIKTLENYEKNQHCSNGSCEPGKVF